MEFIKKCGGIISKSLSETIHAKNIIFLFWGNCALLPRYFLEEVCKYLK